MLPRTSRWVELLGCVWGGECCPVRSAVPPVDTSRRVCLAGGQRGCRDESLASCTQLAVMRSTQCPAPVQPGICIAQYDVPAPVAHCTPPLSLCLPQLHG